MRDRELDRVLRQVHRNGASDRRAHHRGALADELGARHARLYRRQRWIIMKQSTWMRPLLACLTVAILGVAACQTPTEYEVPAGQNLDVVLPSRTDGAIAEEQVDAMADFCRQWPGAEHVNIAEHRREAGVITTDLSIWGEDLDGRALLEALAQRYPVVDPDKASIEPLKAVVETNVAERLGHAVLNLNLDGETAEDIRRQVIEQLEAQGYDGNAVIDIKKDGDQDVISIEMSGTVNLSDGEDSAGQTLTVEQK